MTVRNAMLIVGEDGSLQATPELKSILKRFAGCRLELVHQDGKEFHFRAPSMMKELRNWRDLQGIFADSPFDPNAEMEADRLAELERDTR